MARVNAARDIFAALPGIWTKSLTEELLAPRTACTPLQPSLPIVAISMMLPSAYTATTEITPLSGKNMWSSELSASMRTCSRWQGMYSRSGMSRLRLRDGRASKSRLRGQFELLIPCKHRQFALVASGWVADRLPGKNASQEPHQLRDVNLGGEQSSRLMPDNTSKEETVPSGGGKAGRAELAALFDFSSDVAPLDTPVFAKRLGELLVRAARSSRKRSKRSKRRNPS